MKKLVMIALGALLFSACEKLDRKEKECSVVDNANVPAVVNESFRAKYPTLSVEKWFDKDGNGFAALFTSGGSKKISVFNADGGFVKEQNAEEDENDDHEKGCEIEEGDDD